MSGTSPSKDPSFMNFYHLRRLIDECPKLRSIGRLIHLREHTGGARRDNLEELHFLGRRDNWDMNIVWVSPITKIATEIQ